MSHNGTSLSQAMGPASNAMPAVTVTGNSFPNIESNHIKQGSGPGVLFEQGAKGALRDNRITGSGGSGLEVRDQNTKPTVEGNQMTENQQHGIFVHYGGSGTFT